MGPKKSEGNSSKLQAKATNKRAAPDRLSRKSTETKKRRSEVESRRNPTEDSEEEIDSYTEEHENDVDDVDVDEDSNQYEMDSQEDGEDEEQDDSNGEDDGLRPVDGYAVGLDAGNKAPTSIEELDAQMLETNLNFICLDMNVAKTLLDELSLDSSDSSGVIVGKIDLGDCTQQQMQNWLAWDNPVYNHYAFAAHLGLQAVMITLPLGIVNSSSLMMECCRLLTSVINKFPPTAPQIWLKIDVNQWVIWDKIRHGIDHNPHVFVALNTAISKSAAIDHSLEPSYIRRWMAEPIKAIFLDLLLFSSSNAKSHQAKTRFLRCFFDFKMHFILTPATDSNALGIFLENLHAEFTNWREEPLAEDDDVAESLMLDQNFSFSFRDKLQTPLDPLDQNLDQETYTVMEEDPIKYQRYEMALIAAARDLKKQLGLKKDPLRILVVGPGRGPLIASSLVAAAVNQIAVEIIAIEKNRNAVRTLRHRFAAYLADDEDVPPTSTQKKKEKTKSDSANSSKSTVLQNRVRIIEGDMREQVHQNQQIAPNSVHIIVSELLGSFADNEASPECLYSIEHVLHRQYGVMIPQSYTSYLSPVSATLLWQQARVMFNGHHGKNQFQQQGLNYPYVVHLHSHATCGGQSQPTFQVQNYYS